MKMDFSKVLGAINSLDKKASYNEDKDQYWQPTVDSAGNGYAVIRFLPDRDLEQVPFVRIFKHAFKNENTGRWYIENSLTTIGKVDPVGELNQESWNNGDQEAARKRKRNVVYTSNILVIKDSGNPENEGKVFKYNYGQKIFNKIKDAAQPEFEDQTPINVFDPVEGANFKLKIKNVAGYRNYDSSLFEETPSAVKNWDDIKEKLFDIQELISPKNFKSYDELKAHLDKVMGTAAPAQSRPAPATEEFDDDDSPFVEEVKKVTKAETAKPATKQVDDDDDEDFFASLKNGL